MSDYYICASSYSTNTEMNAAWSRWSCLPKEILELVVMCLPFDDHVRLGAVCTAWRSAASEAPLGRGNLPPWVFLGFQYANDDSHGIMECYDIWRSKAIRIPIPTHREWFDHGVFYGWVIISNICSSEVHLLNPISKTRIDLPPLPPEPPPLSVLVSSSNPVGGRATIVAACYYKKVLMCRVGEGQWTTIQDLQDIVKGLILVHDEDGLVYLHMFNDDLVVYNRDYQQVGLISNDLPSSMVEVPSDYKVYYVSHSEDLLKVVIHVRLHDFFVMKLDDTDDDQWVEMKGLGGGALFLNSTDTRAFSVDNCAMLMELKRDSIYYKDFEEMCVWVLSVEDGSKNSIQCDPFFNNNSAWFSPSLH